MVKGIKWKEHLHNLRETNLQDQFTVLKKCRTKLDCLIYGDAVYQEQKTKS